MGCQDFIRVFLDKNYPFANSKGVKEQVFIHWGPSTGNFSIPSDRFAWNPTVYYIDTDELFRLGEEFLRIQSDEPQLFYIWGHAYELDAWDFWDRFEEFCAKISGKDDIFYGTNREILGL